MVPSCLCKYDCNLLVMVCQLQTLFVVIGESSYIVLVYFRDENRLHWRWMSL